VALTASVQVIPYCLCSALLGLLLGEMARRNWTLGWCVTTTTSFIFTALAGHTAVYWTEVHAQWKAWVTALLSAEDAQGNALNADMSAQIEAIWTWFNSHWAYVGFGMIFGGVLLTTAALSAMVYRKLVADGFLEPAHRTFTQVRPPEHLVWAAIALAGLWFLDARWPSDWIRFIAWNGAIAMTAIYWLNGLSAFAFAVLTFKVGPLWTLLLFFFIILFNLHQFFAVIGLFDTWFDFRNKALRLYAARHPDGDAARDE
jgi:hypothetical protein